MDLIVVGGSDEESLRILSTALEAARILRRERGVEIHVVPHTDLLSPGGPTYFELEGKRIPVEAGADRSKILRLIETLSTFNSKTFNSTTDHQGPRGRPPPPPPQAPGLPQVLSIL